MLGRQKYTQQNNLPLHVHWVNDVRHTDIHTAEPVVPEPSAFEVGLVIEKLKSHKSPDPDPTQIFPFGAAFVCQAGNVWTLLRTSVDATITHFDFPHGICG